MNKPKTTTYGIVRFQRQMDKTEDFVRCGEVKDRVEALAIAKSKVPYLTMDAIKGVDLKRVRLVLE